MGLCRRILLIIASLATIFSSCVLALATFGPYTGYITDLLGNGIFALVVEVCLLLSVLFGFALLIHAVASRESVAAFVHPSDNVDIQISTAALTKTIKTAVEETGELFVDTIEVAAPTMRASEAVYTVYCAPLSEGARNEGKHMPSALSLARTSRRNTALCDICNAAIERAQAQAKSLVGASVARVVIKVLPSKTQLHHKMETQKD